MRKFQLLATALAFAMVGASGAAQAAQAPASQPPATAEKQTLPAAQDQGNTQRFAQRDDDDDRGRRGRGRGRDDGDRSRDHDRSGDQDSSDDQNRSRDYQRNRGDNRSQDYRRTRDDDRARDYERRRDYDRRPNYDRRGFDNRRDVRRGDWRRFHRNLSHDRRYNVGRYYAPSGYRYHRFRYGDRLPRIYFGSRFWLSDFFRFGLFAPPPGLIWVRYGPDALLIDRYTGEIVQVRYNVFY